MRPIATPTANWGSGTRSCGLATFMNQLGVKGNTRAKIMYTVSCDRLATMSLRNSTMRSAKKWATCVRECMRTACQWTPEGTALRQAALAQRNGASQRACDGCWQGWMKVVGRGRGVPGGGLGTG